MPASIRPRPHEHRESAQNHPLRAVAAAALLSSEPATRWAERRRFPAVYADADTAVPEPAVAADGHICASRHSQRPHQQVA